MVSLRQLFQAPARRVARLRTLITDYDAKVHALESLPSPPRPSLQSTQRVWDAAMARDRLARALKVCEIPGPDAVEQIASHDQRLKQQATRLEKLVEQKTLVGWRETLGAAPEAWWWSLDEHLVASRRPIELPLLRWRIPLTWSWHLLRTCAWHWFVAGVPWAVLTVAAAFMAEVARRGLAGNPDLLTAFIALAQGAVALFTANQLIARRGQTPAPADRRGLQAPPGDGWRLLGAGMLLAAAWLLYAWGLPRLSGLYFDRGDEAFNFRTVNDLDDPNYADSHQPVTAIEHLQRAVSLDPSNAEAHYRLGLLYGRLLDVDRASSSFRAAMAGRQGPVLYAPINLSVVLLESEKYAQALEVLNIPPALDHAEGNAFAYLLDRQRGWALLGLTHYEEANRALDAALRRLPAAQVEAHNASLGRGAHCLKALVHEARLAASSPGERALAPDAVPPAALEEWAQCLVGHPVRANVEEHYAPRWPYQACERLRAAGREHDGCRSSS